MLLGQTVGPIEAVVELAHVATAGDHVADYQTGTDDLQDGRDRVEGQDGDLHRRHGIGQRPN
jgi:hypothetical protein